MPTSTNNIDAVNAGTNKIHKSIYIDGAYLLTVLLSNNKIESEEREREKERYIQ